MIDPTPFRRHPVLDCTDVIRAALHDVVDIDLTYMRTEEKAEALRELTTLTSPIEGLRLKVLAASDDVAAEHADKRVADWVARQTRCDKRAAHAQQTLAEALDGRWTRIGGGVTSGRVHLDQARVIVRALDQLPPQIGPEVRRLAEEQLLEFADDFGPRELVKLGERILAYVAPQVADDAERKALEAAERRAETRTRLTYKTRPDGSLEYSGVLPPVEGAILKTVIDAKSSPRRRDQAGGWTDPATGQRLTADQVRGEAFRDLIANLDPQDLGQHGGKPVSVFVTITHRELTTGLGTAQLSTAETITAGHARRLACNAGLIPAVLGTQSEVLDLGRTARLHTPAQRKARLLTTTECQIDGCTVPAAWCDSHHPEPWSQGGKTNLKDHYFACAWHHHKIHDPRYETTYHPDGAITLHRRT
ncbi:HNH endonuclease signature motif containing protein [Nocardioides bigeumensis]